MKKPVKSVYRKRRVFLDTNVILDFLLEREPFYYDVLKLWADCEEGLVEGCVSALTVNNVHYIAARLKSEITAIKAGCSHLFTRDPTHFHSKAIAVVPPSSFVL